MADYTYQELIRMQNDAVRRAQEMERRAQHTAGLSEEKTTQKESVPPHEPKHIPMPEGYLRRPGEGGEKDSGNHNSTDFEKIKKGFSDLAMDSDSALRLSLIMLLTQEGADEMLVMALIYMLT